MPQTPVLKQENHSEGFPLLVELRGSFITELGRATRLPQPHIICAWNHKWSGTELSLIRQHLEISLVVDRRCWRKTNAWFLIHPIVPFICSTHSAEEQSAERFGQHPGATGCLLYSISFHKLEATSWVWVWCPGRSSIREACKCTPV